MRRYRRTRSVSRIARFKPLWPGLPGVFVLAAYAGGCRDAPRTPADSPTRGGTLSLCVSEPLEGLDPRDATDAYAQRVTRLLFESIGGLIETVEWESPLELLLTIRADSVFHDNPCFAGGRGRRVTASDVAFTLDRMAAPGSRAFWILNNRIQGADMRHEQHAGHVKGVKTIDDCRLRLTLVRPFYPIVDVLTLDQCGVVPREAVERYQDRFRFAPVGSGPFRLAKWIEGDELVLVRSERYVRRDRSETPLPFLDRIRMRYVRPAIAQWNEFLAGRTDQCQVPKELVHAVILGDEREGYHLAADVAALGWLGFTEPKVPPFVVYLGVDCGRDNPVARSSLLRRAIATALDRSVLARIAGADMAPAEGLLPPGFPGHADRSLLPAFDVAEARMLLGRTDIPGARTLPVLTLYVPAGRRMLAEAVARQLGLIGLRLRIVEDSFGAVMAAVRRGDADLFLSGMTSSTFLHPEGFLAQFHGRLDQAVNKVRYGSDRFDRIYEEAGATADPAKRLERYAAAEQVLMTELPIIPLAWARQPSFFVTSHRMRMPGGAPATDLLRTWIIRNGS